MTEFNNILNNRLKKINQGQKTVFLIGDFNIDLMHYNEHKPTNEILDSLASNPYLPHIIQPSRHTSHSKIYRNLLSTLMKQSKQIFHKKYFKNKWNNIKNTWKGIKTIISIKNITTRVRNISTAVTHLIEFDNNNITNPTAMSMFLITTSLL